MLLLMKGIGEKYVELLYCLLLIVEFMFTKMLIITNAAYPASLNMTFISLINDTIFYTEKLLLPVLVRQFYSLLL